MKALLFAIGLLAGQAVVQIVGPASWCEWSQVTTDIQGQPEVVSGYEVALVASQVDLNAGGTLIRTQVTDQGGWQGVQLAQLLTGIPSGQYRIQVRARDEAGNLGRWSEPLAVRVDVTPPAQVVGVGVELRVSITVPTNP
ncbi:MAG: hypothetical protein ACREIE_08935 [Nitrospiraceae bacterium]